MQRSICSSSVFSAQSEVAEGKDLDEAALWDGWNSGLMFNPDSDVLTVSPGKTFSISESLLAP